MKDKNLENELKIFESISSKEDYQLIIKDEIGFEDFERLSFILQKLDLLNINLALHEKHFDKFKVKYEMLNKLNQEYGPCVDIDKIDEWLDNFLNNISDDNKREFIEELFK